MASPDSISPDDSLGKLAATRPGAIAVLYRHGLDFACRGQASLGDACDARGLTPADVADEIAREARDTAGFERWDERPLPELIDYILRHHHEAHRKLFDELIEVARRVETAHRDNPTYPHDLALLLADMRDQLEQHMQKEEVVLFPLLRERNGGMASAPIQAMELEHGDHAHTLAQLRAMTDGYRAPQHASEAWTALYRGLARLERELLEHIHLENNVLFPRALVE